ncbi:MAG: serpin family protein [Cyanobacteria bacterium J06623_7]
MNRNTLWGTFAAAILLVLTGLVSLDESSSISSPENSAVAANKSVDTAEMKISQLVAANNRFSFNLFQQLQSTSPENIFISPQSVAIALAMLRNGTAGETQAEITAALELSELEPTGINPAYSKLTKTLKTAANDVELAIANSLWINQNVAIKAEFIELTQDSYQSIATNLNFAEPTAVETINQWVASNTAHKITEIVDAVSPADAIYLINAIYFKGSWTKKFDSGLTKPQPFTLDSGVTKSVAMMNQRGNYRYYENSEFQAIRLPYGQQAELGMYIFLPQPDSSLEQFNQQLNLDNWQEWLMQMRSQPGKINLPKFKLEYDTELKNVLATLGVIQVFDDQKADFSSLTDSSVAVDTVRHKAAIEVNEEGTEAAGVTSIGVRITSARPQKQPFNFNADRPFFFAIRDDITETILFMGNVVEP